MKMMTGTHIAQASRELSVYSNLTLNFWPFCLSPVLGLTIDMLCHTGFYAARAQVQKF